MPEKSLTPVPEGVSTLTPHLWYKGDCKAAIEFYQKAFGATVASPPVPTPDGKGIIHVKLTIGDSHVMMADAWPGLWEQGPQTGATASLWVFVEDCDAVFNQAVAEGCEVLNPMMDMFWGDRTGKVKDPFGHCWAISSQKWIMTPEEMQQGYDGWIASLG